jgi:N-dimethylarginine dimethylaminohydrolase
MYDNLYTASMSAGGWKETLPPSGLVPEQIIEETEEDLDLLIHALDRFAVSVYRPNAINFNQIVATPDWKTDGQYAYCPRDTHLIIGDMVIEAPMTTRARQHEAILLDTIKRQAIQDGAKWISAPRPRLLDSENLVNGEFKLTEAEPAFDAANICRLGKDLLFLIGPSGNRLGARWLQNILGNGYKVHICDMYSGVHIDSTIVPIAEGTVLLNANRVNEDNVPSVFDDWDKIYIKEEDIVSREFYNYPYASSWIGINMLSIDQSTVIVDEVQTNIINILEKKNFTVVPVPLRHSRTLGGGFHCVTLDLERDND